MCVTEVGCSCDTRPSYLNLELSEECSGPSRAGAKRMYAMVRSSSQSGRNRPGSSWQLAACTTEEILSYIQALDATKASGPDGISIKMLKYTATSIAPSLAKLFNISIKLAWALSNVLENFCCSYPYRSHPNTTRLPIIDQYLSYL